MSSVAAKGNTFDSASDSSVAPILGLTVLDLHTLNWQWLIGVLSPIHSLLARQLVFAPQISLSPLCPLFSDLSALPLLDGVTFTMLLPPRDLRYKSSPFLPRVISLSITLSAIALSRAFTSIPL